MFVHTNGKLSREKQIMMRTSQQALAFIAGTGLDIMIQEYEMDYDADSIRENFFQIFHVKAT